MKQRPWIHLCLQLCFFGRYHAPRRDAARKIIEQGAITAWLNGDRVQHQTRFAEPKSIYHPYRHGTTPYLQAVEQALASTMTGPLFLQDHNNAVQFRNVWIKPLDGQAVKFRQREASHQETDAKLNAGD